MTKGLAFEAVFYPKVGAKVQQLRAEFVVALMEAAGVLGITLVPPELHHPFTEDLAHAAGASATGATAPPHEGKGAADTSHVALRPEVAAALEGLMPSPALAAMAGYYE